MLGVAVGDVVRIGMRLDGSVLVELFVDYGGDDGFEIGVKGFFDLVFFGL